MEIKYSRDVDILLVKLPEAPVDHAEESEGLIVHLAEDGKPVLFEIQGGREFLLGSLTSMVKGEEVVVA